MSDTNTFEKLNLFKHNIRTINQSPEISNSNIPTQDNQYSECWLYSDLHNLLGADFFPTSPNMDANVYKHIYMPCTPNNKRGKIELVPSNATFHDAHVVPIHHSFTLGVVGYKNATDLELSRYACWCLMRQSPSLMFERLYFLHPNITYFELYKSNTEFNRIQLRNLLSTYEKRLNGILYRISANFSLFNHETIRPFFGGYTTEELRDMYNIKNKSAPIFDYVGPLTLMARINALDKTIRAYNRTGHTMSAHDLSYNLWQDLISERNNLVYSHQTYPEGDIRPNMPVQKLQRQLNNIEQNFIREYANKKLR